MGTREKKSQTYSERSEEKRAAYLDTIATIAPKDRVYIDESGMNDNDFYPYAYAKRGERYDEAHPGHYTKRLSMIGGWSNKAFQAPFVFQGHCNTATFELYIERILVPTLRPGQCVIMDNASFHKSARTKDLIEAAGCQLHFLPPYSPDLNPIEHDWHKIKTRIRKIRRDSKDSLEKAMIHALKKSSIC